MNNYVGILLRRALAVGLVVLAVVCRLAAGGLTQSAWNWYAQWKGLPPQEVGGVAQADTPRAHSIAEMERLDLFTVEQVQEDWDDSEYIHVGRDSTAYKILTLDSGERVAARCSGQYQYDPGANWWLSPVGRWVPWDLDETERASVEWQGVGLTTLDYYVDMDGSAWDEGWARFQGWFPWVGALGLWVLAVALILLIRLLLWPLRESNRPRNDVERWLVGTHAIWGQSIAQFNRILPGKGALPIRFGGLPRTPFTRWELRMTLRGSWDIHNYQELLETVKYMSRGDGFRDDMSQPAKAWQLSRCTALLGAAMVLGWAGRKELVERSREIGKLIQTHFSSWEELAMGFLEDYARWCTDQGGSNAQEKIQHRVDCYYLLQKQADSPYSLPWNLDLDAKK